MGRAARSKQIRRNGRTWTTRNPWTGEREQFRVFISDKGLAEWERDRIRLAKTGYPDYPPAVDSRVSRAWVTNRDEPLQLAGLRRGDVADEHEGLWVSDDAHWIVRGIVHARADGRYDVRVSYADNDGFGLSGTFKMDKPVAPAYLLEFEHHVAKIAELLDLPAPRWVAASDLITSVLAAA